MKKFLLPAVWCFLVGMLFPSLGCDMADFESAAYLDSQRFLAIQADPLEAAPGEEITFTALAVREDGQAYDGPMAWTIVGGNATQTEDSNTFDPATAAVTSPGQPFVWTVLDRDQLEERFGPFQENGLLLTVVAAIFKNGDMNQEARMAYKMFVVSEREPDRRLVNPVLTEIVVSQGGKEISPNTQGEYAVTDGKVELRAFTDQPDDDDLSFYWFSIDKDFEPDYSDSQTLKTNGHELLPLYCVLRQEVFFETDAGGRIRLTGTDWRSMQIRTQ